MDYGPSTASFEAIIYAGSLKHLLYLTPHNDGFLVLDCADNMYRPNCEQIRPW